MRTGSSTRRAPTEWPRWLVLFDNAAGDSVPGVARGIAFHIIRLGMNHKRRAAIAEHRVRIVAHGDVWISHCRLCSAVASDLEVVHVPGVRSLGILEPVFFVLGVEMRTRRLEPGRFALSDLVYVDSMLARR